MTDTTRLDAYVQFFEELSPETLDSLAQVTAPEVRFSDPFNDVRGRDAMRAVLADMFRKLGRPRFIVTHRAWDDDTAFLRWRMEARAFGGPWTVEGMSEVRFDQDGLVREHVDHWDSGTQVYARLPVLGALIRMIRRRIAA